MIKCFEIMHSLLTFVDHISRRNVFHRESMNTKHNNTRLKKMYHVCYLNLFQTNAGLWKKSAVGGI